MTEKDVHVTPDRREQPVTRFKPHTSYELESTLFNLELVNKIRRKTNWIPKSSPEVNVMQVSMLNNKLSPHS